MDPLKGVDEIMCALFNVFKKKELQSCNKTMEATQRNKGIPLLSLRLSRSSHTPSSPRKLIKMELLLVFGIFQKH